MLSLVLPKGSLEKATLDLFDAADLTVRRASDRDYHASIDDPRIERVRFLRPQEIPSYLERGLFDIGITGRDWITETQADVTSLGQLQYSKATSNPVPVVLRCRTPRRGNRSPTCPTGTSLVLPKGSLEKATLDLFDAADLTVRRASDRDYHASIDDPRIERVRFLRPQEIPSYLERGLFDIGITGRDWITETQADVTSLGQLQYSKATSNPVRVVLAVPDGAPWQSVSELPDGIRISTEFPSMTERYLAEHGVKAMIVPSYGATEAKVPDIVDAIVDLTETGSSLRKNGLRILETILTSYTELVACGAAYADEEKRAAMEDIALLLRGAIQARGHVLLKLNVPSGKLEAVTAMLPAMSSPTVTALANTSMNALETVVPKRGVNTLIPALKAAGARDILEIPISKIVE